MVTYRLEQFPENLVMKLHKKIIEYKVFKQKKFDDLDQLFAEKKVEVSEIADESNPGSGNVTQRGNSSLNLFKKKAGALLKGQGAPFPDKMYVIKRDRI